MGATAASLRSFYRLLDLSTREFAALLDLAATLKRERRRYPLALRRRSLGLVFLNPSLRTRASMSLAMMELGGYVLDLSPSRGLWPWEFQEGAVMEGEAAEHIREAVRVMSRYCDLLAVRASRYVPKAEREKVLRAFLENSAVPVVNLESDWYHPCQGLGDALTLKEMGLGRGSRYVYLWTYHPKPLPQATTHSQLAAACLLGMEVVLAHPPGWELDPEEMSTLEARAREAGGSLRVVQDPRQALQGAAVVVSKSWGALSLAHCPQEELRRRMAYRDWRVREQLFEGTQALYMHCLPVRRNVEVDDAVLDGPRARVIDQAENRLHAQKAVLLSLLRS